MSDAPDATQVKTPQYTPEVSSCPAPTLSLIGVGGCGINIGRRVIQQVGTLPDFTGFIDTSRANIRDQIQVSVIANSHGSGKLRESNANELIQTIAQLDEETVGNTDIAIVIFGAAGGTGSVAGPLLVQELRRRGTTVIAVVSADSTSGVDAKNTMGTLRTLANMTNASKDREGFYLPTIITSTSTDRTAADRYLTSQVVNTIRLLKLPTFEIDRNDRLSFLDAHKTIGKDVGIHTMYVLEKGQEKELGVADLHDPKVFADSALFVGVEDGDFRHYAENPAKHAEFRKDGLFADPKETPLTGITMSTSETLKKIIDDAAEAERLFKTQRDKSNSEVNSALLSGGDKDDSGLVL